VQSSTPTRRNIWCRRRFKTDRYVSFPPGYPSLYLLAMATPALRTRLRLAIDKATTTRSRVLGGRSRRVNNGVTSWFDIDVEFLASESEDLLLVCFVEETSREAGSAAANKGGATTREAGLERELETTQAELQSLIQHQETSKQEQKATNEKLLTSKEELQSLNEELTALNSQLQETLERQRMTSDDLQNVLFST
jgi:two-component system CheB/CheR fusion protein